MTDKRTDDEIRADVIVSHFLGTEIVPAIPDALRLSEQIAAEDDAAVALVAISRWIDAGNAHRHAETNLWSRVSKAAEEGGEAMDALRGVLGENPRKGQVGSMDDVVEELLDTAVAALGAVEHIRDHDGQALTLLNRKIARVLGRAASVGRPKVHDPGVHRPFIDDGVTYCGIAGDGGIYEGCGHLWPCPAALSGDHGTRDNGDDRG